MVIRGACIKQIAGVKHTLERLLIDTERKLEILTKKEDAHTATAIQVAEARTKYTAAYATRRHRDGDKTGTLLAWLAKQDTELKPITEIVDLSGRLVRAQSDILQAFRHYYTTIYLTPPQPTKKRSRNSSTPYRFLISQTKKQPL